MEAANGSFGACKRVEFNVQAHGFKMSHGNHGNHRNIIRRDYSKSPHTDLTDLTEKVIVNR